ncbi:MAG: hypothetical protein KF767_02350 [Bdellovibrionaceae bacterium]|nr:hypothetical protein [Pseudobdellovibrionaceae bacterium]
MSKPNVPDTDRLFDEIAGKLNELSGNKPSESPAERFEKLQAQLKRSQEDWKSAQSQMQERMQNFEQFSNSQNELTQEMRRSATLLEQERVNNSKTASDLAKALELNLKLQFDIEEIRTKAGQLVAEERKHNLFLVEKNRNLSTELELSQAMNQEVRLELGKAREKFLQDQNQWTEQQNDLQSQMKVQAEEFEAANMKIDELEQVVQHRDVEINAKAQEISRQSDEIRALMDTLKGFEEHANMQNDTMRALTATAEKKLVELKLALDKKIIESNDYYSHLQQALAQVQILRQENGALKEYITKLQSLHQGQNVIPAATNGGAYVSETTNPGIAPIAPMPQPAPVAVAPAPTPAPVEPAPFVAAMAPTAPASAPVPQPATSFGSPMTVPSTPAFMASSTPAPVPNATPAPAWMTSTPTPGAPPKPGPPPKPSAPGMGMPPKPGAPQSMAASAEAPPKPRPPFPGKVASGH